MPPPLAVVFVVADVLLVLALLAALRVRVRERRLLGEVVDRELPGRRGRVAAAVVVVLVHALALAQAEVVSPAWTVPPLALTLAFVLVRPGLGDRVCGTEGVRRGWSVRGLGELEEWRLTGDHLRFRLRGEWTAVRLAASRHEAFGETLRRLLPDRESPYR